jgi:hypothetical protein
MRRRTFVSVRVAALLAGLLFSGSVAAQSVTGNRQGEGGSAVQGAAGTRGSAGDSGLEKCTTPMASVAVVEPQSQSSTHSARIGSVRRLD